VLFEEEEDEDGDGDDEDYATAKGGTGDGEAKAGSYLKPSATAVQAGMESGASVVKDEHAEDADADRDSKQVCSLPYSVSSSLSWSLCLPKLFAHTQSARAPEHRPCSHQHTSCSSRVTAYAIVRV